MKKQIGAKIKAGRERIGISQGTLGMIALGYPKSEINAAQMKISKIESGKVDVTIPDLIKIAEVLKIELKDVLGFDLPLAPSPQETDTGPPQSISWELRTIIEGLQNQIKDVSTTVHKYKGDSERAYAVVEGHTESIKNLNHAIDQINNHLQQMKNTMSKAATTGDIKRLKAVGEDR